MKVIGINGSPRKNWNTALLIKKALEGASSIGTETELIHLYDLNYQGCISCFECKKINGKSYGKCRINDELTNVLNKISNAEIVILGSPNYLGMPTGNMLNLLERMIYPYVVYEKEMKTLIEKKKPVGFIYTMNSSDLWMKQMGYDKTAYFYQNMLSMIFKYSEALVVNDTLQFDDYSKYYAPRFDPDSKKKRRNEVFPADLEKAYQMGINLVNALDR